MAIYSLQATDSPPRYLLVGFNPGALGPLASATINLRMWFSFKLNANYEALTIKRDVKQLTLYVWQFLSVGRYVTNGRR
jgi:hypothetical protein